MAADAGVTGDVMAVGFNGAGGLLLELALVALGKGVPAKLVAVIGELELVGRDADLAGAMLRPDGFRGSADDEGTRDDGEADGGVLASDDEADS